MKPAVVDIEFKKVMIPAILMGLITNIYVIALVWFLEAFNVLYSPIIGALLFVTFCILLIRDKISAKQAFIFVAYTVIIEVCLHSYFFGWGMGFYYYMFLLPILFLTGPSWSMKATVFINTSVVLVTCLLWYLMYCVSPVFEIPLEVESTINILNLTGTAFINLVIMVYFSRTINKKDQSLTKVNIDLERQNKEIVGQHSNLEILLKEIHHRVKNNLQIISSLMSLERNKVENKEVVAILNKSKRRIEAIALIHKKLYQDENFNRVDFKSYIEELMNSQKALNSNLKCIVDSEDVVFSLDTAVPLGLIISEMITNSVKHAFDGVDSPELKIKLTHKENGYELIVHDNGIGLPVDFDLDNPLSLGVEIINALAEQIEARIEFSNDNGAKFKIHFTN
jgi:two-component sensor histidine kinase